MKNDEFDFKVNLSLNGVDFHTHILPNMDDGSRCVEESIAMLSALAEQGIKQVVLTPHFYANGDDPEHFFARREMASAALNNAISELTDKSLPKLILGAEVEYFEGVAEVDELQHFGIGNSGYMLIEMPFDIWSPRMIDAVLRINERKGCKVVIAHVERYLFAQKKDTVYTLLQNGIVMQSNASFFTNKKTSRKAIHALKNGWIHLLGSDCHNMTTRPPNIGEAMSVISKKVGEGIVYDIMADATSLLGGRFNG